MPPALLALDIGGANLKAAHSTGIVQTVPFALWQDPAGLADALRDLYALLPAFDRLAVTMTGELCDCYPTRREGVLAILDAVERIAGDRPCRTWTVDGRLEEIVTVREAPLQAAAANWLALAVFAGRYVPTGPALLLDIGSTTTDVIPLLHGTPMPAGRTDRDRLRSGELVYTGVERTPLCALLFGDGAAELFATTADAYRVLGKLPEQPDLCQTADGRPATREASHARLARMICADIETTTAEERRGLALRVAHRQVTLVRTAIDHVASRLPGPVRTVIVSGSGEFLARSALETESPGVPLLRPERVVSLAEELGPGTSRAACAHALAVLAGEQWT